MRSRTWFKFFSLLLINGLIFGTATESQATLSRLLQRRSSETDNVSQNGAMSMSAGDKVDNNKNQNQPSVTQGTPARLYPDLPREPVGAFAPPPAPQPFQPNLYPPNQGPTLFVPFGPHNNPAGRFNDLQLRLQPRPMTGPERQSSQSFVSGLGQRLLAMVGINPSGGSNETEREMQSTQPEEAARALQNITVLDQLNRGIHSVYGGLSRMYNSTVQKQLDLLQERFKNETASTDNPWHQRMAKQVPEFFKQMAAKVEDAQSNMNRLWQQMIQQANSKQNSTTANQVTAPTFRMNAAGEEFFGSVPRSVENAYQTDSFFSQVGRSLGLNQQSNPNDLGNQLSVFWHDRVQPQLGMIQGQISRVWRDLTTSGAYMPENAMSFRRLGVNQNSPQKENKSDALLDDILKAVDLNGPEYSLIEGKGEQEDGQGNQERQGQEQAQPGLSPDMQNRLIMMQREINQLWGGLTNSLQAALSNVKRSLNPRQPPEPFSALQPRDPNEKEIDGQIQDLSKLQREADVVHSVVRQQQDRAQQGPSFGDRFRNFFNNVELPNVDQLTGRIGESVSRWGNAVGDAWNRIPDRWDNLMNNMKPQQQQTNGRLSDSSTVAPESSSKPTN